MATPLTLVEYYRDPHVRARIIEYCGGAAGRPISAVYLATTHPGEQPFVALDHAPRHGPDQLDALLASGSDIARSMWDRESLLLHFDFDYINVDNPAEVHTHPADVFYKIEPAYRAAQHVFARHGLVLLPVVTGRGYHFTGLIPLASPVVDQLAGLLPHPPRWMRSVGERHTECATPEINSRYARAWVGTGMLAEFLAHQILRRARPRSPIPIVLNNTVVGTGEVGRECLSIDLTYAGDPMDIRHMRVAFGAYQKHRFRPDVSGAAASHPPLIAVLRGGESIEHMLSHRSDLRHAARLARTTSATPPDTSAGVERVLEAYQGSRLAAFHQAYGSASPASRRATGDGPRAVVPRRVLPACVTRAIEAPNDLLLQPSFIQHVTRVLMAEGLPPRDIAALIQARYDADHGWGQRWSWMDSESRALFDVRVFSGLLISGADEAIDLNCRSTQEKGLCPGGECGRDLRTTRAQLLEAVRS